MKPVNILHSLFQPPSHFIFCIIIWKAKCFCVNPINPISESAWIVPASLQRARHANKRSNHSNICGSGWKIWLQSHRWRVNLFPIAWRRNEREQGWNSLYMYIYHTGVSIYMDPQNELKLDKPVLSLQEDKRQRFTPLFMNTSHLIHFSLQPDTDCQQQENYFSESKICVHWFYVMRTVLH